MNLNHVVDLETLSRKENAHILSIGIVTIDLDLPLDRAIIRQDCMVLDKNQPHRFVDLDTLDWWQKQTEEAYNKVFQPVDTRSLKSVVSSFSRYLDKHPYPIWGYGSEFDNVILAHAFDQFEYVWPYQLNRCLRTLKHVVLSRTSDLSLPKFEGVRHDALADALYQAKLLHTFINNLNQP